jgi:hypothetical protein
MKSVFVRTCALRRKAEMQFFQNSSQFQAACKKKFFAYLRNNICLNVFELKVQADLWIFDLSAIALIILAARKRISQENVVCHCGKDDRMALPSVDFLNSLPCFHLR